MERRLAAILAADVVGFSRLMEIDEAGTLAALKALRAELIDPRIAEHNGRTVKLMGDGALVEFASVVDAVSCAVAIQTGLAERYADVPDDRRIEMRIGVHLGDVMVEDEDLYGDGVNVAARLEGLAEPGGICLSQQAYDQVETKLDLSWQDLGDRQVKNIARPVHVWRCAPTASPATQRVPESPASGEAVTLALPDKPSLAVLPFDNLSGDPDQEYFADGVVEEITAALSRVRSFFVIARNSAFTFKGRAVDVKQISRELGVRYVIEGSVRKSGDRLRITAQLIDAVTGVHVWADRYDGSLDDVFALQDSVTESIVGAIEPQLRLAEIMRSKRKPPNDLTAYDLFLRALPRVYESTAEGNQEAIRFLKKSIEIDPNYASAMALLAWCYTLRVSQGWVQSMEAEAGEALRLADRAARASEDDPEVLWLAGYARAYYGDELEAGLALIERALELDPNAAQAWVFSGWVNLYIGKAERSLEHFQRAMRLSPVDPAAYRTHSGLAFAYLCLGQFEDAVSWARKAFHENDRFSPTHRVLAASLAHEGQLAEAGKVVDALLDLVPGLTVTRYAEETRFRFPAYFDVIMDGMRKAGLPE